MGCTASKLENEDTVRRCKERRRFMKEAVYARHHLAAAHSDYCRSLRLTGSALSTFAAGEPLSVSDQTPAVFLRTPSNTAATTTTTTKHYQPPPIYVPSPSPSVHPPPPPPPISPSVHSSKLPHILSSPTHLRRKRQPPQPMKLPHILSDSSSFSSSPKRSEQNFTYHARANSTFSNTPSQDGSSVWNWEHFYPPSPPHSEYFEQLQTKKSNNYNNNNSHHYLDEDEEADTFDDKSSNYTSYSRYSHNKLSTNVRDQKSHIEAHPPPPDHHWESEEGEREEVQCGEWEDHDHYSTTSSSDIEGDDDEDDMRSRSDIGTRSNFSEAIGNMNGNGKGNSRAPSMSNVNFGVKHSTTSKLDKLSDDGESSWGYGNKGGDTEMNSDRRMVVRHKDLVEIVAAIKEYFDKAATGGQQVSEMLETGRAQIDRSFSQLKKTVYHSSGLLSNLSSSWSSKPPLAVKYKFEPMSIEQSGGTKSLCSTLERLFAWEKKLYEEVKARERVKIEHEKKLSTLQSQESKREEESKLDKTKTSINRLQSLITVTSQAVSSTSSAIITQRDSELVPQLVELCHGFMYMWRSMNQYHEVQNDIVQQVRGLINRSIKGELTSDLHRQATRDLESAVSTWHSSFCRLIKFQRDFIRSLHGWFKLSLTPVNIETNHGKRDTSDAFSFCDEWKLALDRIPDTVASEAIKSFINVVHSISVTQTEEMKVKKRTETASKELEKKASSVRSIERKYYNEFSMVGLGLPGTDDGHGLDNRDPLSDKKAELAACQRRVEDELVKHSKAVEVTRAMTLNNLQTGLPGVFQAMTSFSALITEALEAACTRSYAIK